MKVDNKKALELYNNGLNDCQIASQLGTTVQGIRYWRAIKNNLPANLCKSKKIDYESVLSLYQEGYSDKDIGKILKIHPLSVFNWRHQNGLTSNYEKGWPHQKALQGFVPEDKDKPWRDTESLFCDTKFLENLFGKYIKNCKCGTNAWDN